MKYWLPFFCILLIEAFCSTSPIRFDLTYDFLNSGISPIATALGNTGILSSIGAECALFNPAMLTDTKGKNLELSFNLLPFDHSLTYAFYRIPNSYRQAWFGLGIVADTVSNIEYRQSQSDTPTNFAANQIAFIGGFGREVEPGISIGSQISIVNKNYSDINFSTFYGLSVLYNRYKEFSVSGLFRYLNSDEYETSGGIKLNLDPFTLYGQADYYFSPSLTILKPKYGVTFAIVPSFKLYAGRDGDILSVGTSYEWNILLFQYAMTFTDLGNYNYIAIGL